MTMYKFTVMSGREMLATGVIHGEKDIPETLDEYIKRFGEKITGIEVKAI